MASLLSMFGGGGGGVKKKEIVNLKRTVVEEGNVAPGQAFRKSQMSGDEPRTS